MSTSTFKKESAAKTSLDGVKTEVKPIQKFDLNTLPGGKFSLKIVKKSSSTENVNTSV